MVVDLDWSRLGEVELDAEGKLVFPRAPDRPGLYRLAVGDGVVHVGDATLLRRALQQLRTPARTAHAAIVLRQKLTEAVRRGERVTVEVCTRATRGGQPVDLDDPRERAVALDAARG